MILGLLKEPLDENRVALLPESLHELLKLKVNVIVEENAGEKAFSYDKDYQKAGGQIDKREQILAKADIILCIHPPKETDIIKLKPNAVLVGVLNPLWSKEYTKMLCDSGISSFSLDILPRTTRAQAMDILSSMATVAGYKAVLKAAGELPNFFPMFMSAAGTIKPSKVMIIGAGVAGLQAIATARKLGAVVEAFDVRSAVKEEVMSLGAKFIEVEGAKDDKSAGGYAVEQSEDFLNRQKQAIHDHAVKSNVIICTAQIPGKKAPVLIYKNTVDSMIPGSVIIDLAASSGGNCEYTENNKIVLQNGVKIIGNSNFPSELPIDSSRMFGKNLINFLKLFIDQEGNLKLDFQDEIVKNSCIASNKEFVSDRVKNLFV